MNHPQRLSAARVGLILGVILAAMLPYIGTLRNPPVLDDHHFVFEQSFLIDCRNLPRSLSPANFLGVLPVPNSARPVWLASVLLDTCLGKGYAFAYRLTSMYWHGVGAALVMVWAWMLVADLPVCVLAGILFAVHPVHTEVVNIIAFRGDELCLAWMLVSLILYRKGIGRAGLPRWAGLGASLACFALALLSKEMAVSLPLLIVATDALFPVARLARSRRWGIFSLYVGLIGLYLMFHAPRSGYVMPGHQDVFSEWRGRVEVPFSRTLTAPVTAGPGRDSIVREDVRPWRRVYEEPKTRFLTMSRVFGSYLRLLAWPHPLQNDYAPEVIASARHRGVWLSWAAWLSLLAAAWALRRRIPLAAYGLLWTMAALLPVSGIVTLLNLQAERYLYVASAGFCLAVAALLSALARLKGSPWPRAAAIAAAGALAAAGAGLTARRNLDYRGELAFFEANEAVDARVPRVRLALAMLHDDLGHAGRAQAEYQAALRLWPDYLKARLFFADFLRRHGQRRQARAQLEAARRIAAADHVPSRLPHRP